MLDRRLLIFKRQLLLPSIVISRHSEQTLLRQNGLNSPSRNNRLPSSVNHNKHSQLLLSNSPHSTHSNPSQHRVLPSLWQLPVLVSLLLLQRSDSLHKLNNGRFLNKPNSNRLPLPSFKLHNSRLSTKLLSLGRVRHLSLDNLKVYQTSSPSSQINSLSRNKTCQCFLSRDSLARLLNGWSRT